MPWDGWTIELTFTPSWQWAGSFGCPTFQQSFVKNSHVSHVCVQCVHYRIRIIGTQYVRACNIFVGPILPEHARKNFQLLGSPQGSLQQDQRWQSLLPWEESIKAHCKDWLQSETGLDGPGRYKYPHTHCNFAQAPRPQTQLGKTLDPLHLFTVSVEPEQCNHVNAELRTSLEDQSSKIQTFSITAIWGKMLQADDHHHSGQAWIKCKISWKSVRRNWLQLAIRFQKCRRKRQTHAANLSKMQWLLDCGLKPGNLPYEPQVQTLCLPTLKTEKQQVSVSDKNIVWVTIKDAKWMGVQLRSNCTNVIKSSSQSLRGCYEWTPVLPCFDMLSLSPRLIPVHFAPPWHMITGLHMRTAYILRASTSFVIRFWMSRNRHACVVCPLSKITRLVTAGFVCVQSNCQGHQCSVDRELWERSSLEFSTQSDGSLRLHCCMLQLSTFRYVLSHQQSRASHFPVAGFPFPHIQPPSTGLLTLLKHSSMRILVFFENPCKYHWSWAEKCFRRSLHPPTNNAGYPLRDVAFWHGPYSPLRVVEVPYREADVFSWWPHQNCYLKWQPGFSMTQFYAGKSSEVQRWGTSRIQNISKWVA